MQELVFEVTQEADGGYCAECLTENIFTQGDSWEALRKNVLEAVSGHFFDKPERRGAFGCTWCAMKSWPAHENPARLERHGAGQGPVP